MGSCGLGEDFGGGAPFVAPVDRFGVGVVEICAATREAGGDDGEEGPELLCCGGGEGEGRRGRRSVCVCVCVCVSLCVCVCVCVYLCVSLCVCALSPWVHECACGCVYVSLVSLSVRVCAWCILVLNAYVCARAHLSVSALPPSLRPSLPAPNSLYAF